MRRSSPILFLLVSLLFHLSAEAATTYNTPLKHVIVIVQENRRPDNIFGSNPTFEAGVNVQNYGYFLMNGSDKKVTFGVNNPFGGVTLQSCYDLGHNNADWYLQWDNGGLDQQPLAIPEGNNCSSTGTTVNDYIPQPYHAYQYLIDDPNYALCSYQQNTYCDTVDPYFSIAKNYGFANYMFQTNQGPSFAAHQFLFSGTSAPITYPTTYYNWFAAELPSGGGPAGCVSDYLNTVAGINSSRVEQSNWYRPSDPIGANAGFPCYNHPTMADVFAGAAPSISWRYYTQDEYGIWTAPAAIDLLCQPSGFAPLGVCEGPAFAEQTPAANVITPSARVFTDIAACDLAQVTWVTPDGNWSDHAGASTSTLGYGASWVADIINAIGESYTNSSGRCDYWNTEPTAILVTWDDWGGWQDHVKPYSIGYANSGNNNGIQYVYGFRVPLLVVSPYTSAGYVSDLPGGGVSNSCPAFPDTRYCHDFGSILNFIEYVFGTNQRPLGQIGPPQYPYADYFAPDAPSSTCQTCLYSLADFFNFSNFQNFREILPLPPVPASFFTGYTGPTEDPDDDVTE